jgi:hypothetical protein
MILVLSSISIWGETEEAGDIDSEYEGLSVSGGVGGVRYAFSGFGNIAGGGGVDFGGDAWRGSNNGIVGDDRLVDVCCQL